MIIKLLLLFLFLLIGPDVYLYYKYLRRLPVWLRAVCLLPTGILLVSMMVIFLTYEPGQAAMTRLSYFILLFLAITVPKVVFILLILIEDLCHLLFKRRFYAGYIAGVLAICSFAYIIYGATEGKQHFTVRQVTFASPRLPKSFDGYRITLFSDLHTGSWSGNQKAVHRLVNLINAQQSDAILFVGDLVNNLATELDEFIPELQRLRAHDGVWSVLGNHDYSMYIHWKSEAEKAANLAQLEQKQAAMGWHLLNNAHTYLSNGQDSIALIGVENSGNPPFPDRANLPQAMQGTDSYFRILMTHDPTHWRREVVPNTSIELSLSGHTHNMQFSMFGFSPSRFVYPEHDGLYREGEQALFVTIGCGFVMFPFRLGAWPEIVVITLRHSQ